MEPKTFIADDHEIDPRHINADALFVLDQLQAAGHTAYLVGGGVRDLLTKKHPKDFDISTSARPEEIKRLFRRKCILIGKRFRLAHLRFGHHVFEVSTFRSGENESDLIVSDNKWGNPKEDALRRDFTINGLFYDPATHTVIDYVGGWDDIHKGVLRTIGDPEIRFKQDPVRMLRLIKFRARFGFDIDSATKDALIQCRDEIIKSSPARVLEEIFRMLESGAASPFFQMMKQAGMLDHLFPQLSLFIDRKNGKKVYSYLTQADTIHKRRRRTLPRPVLAASFLFPLFEEAVQEGFLNQEKFPNLGELTVLASSLLKGVTTPMFPHFPRKISSEIIFTLAMQYRLTPLSEKRYRKGKFMQNRGFEDLLHLLKLRAIVNPDLASEFHYWVKQYQQFQSHGEKHHPPPKPRESTRRPRKR